MKIRGWQVEGFGVLGDYRVSDLPSGLVLVHGPNEAGKSTLLAFLRGVLFGFPDRRASEPAYPPLRGGRHGGALLLENADGIYRVERVGDKRSPLAIVRPDGSEGGEGDLQRLLGGADRQLFKSVFAFSLQELAGMETLSSDQVRARIFSAGIAGAGRSAREVIEGLDQEATSLLSARAGRIRELVRETQSLSDQIGAAVRRAADYADALRQEEDAGLEVGRLRKELSGAEARARRATTLIDLWPIESDRQEVIRSLDALPAIDSFPADPEERLAGALSDVRATTQAWQDAEQSLQQLLQQRQAIELDDRLAAVADTAADLVADCAVYRERLAKIAEVTGQVREHDDRVAAVLRDLGPGWNESRLASFDASLPAAEEVRKWQERLKVAGHDSDAATSDLASFERQVASVEESLGRITGDLDGHESALTDDWVRAVSARLSSVAEAIAALEARAPGLVFEASALETAAGALAAARQERARLITISAEATGRLEKIVVNETVMSLEEQVNEAARHIEVERQRLRDIDNLQPTQRERQEAVERGIRELGDGWTEVRASVIPTDFTQFQQVRQFAAELAGDRERVIGAERELDHVGKGRSAREKEMQRLQRELAAPEPTSMDTLERQNRTLRRLRTRVAELTLIDAERRGEERVKAEAAAAAAPSVDVGWVRWAPGVGGLVAGVLALFAGWRVLVHDAAGGVVFAVACLLTALLAFGLRLVVARARPSTDIVAGRQRHLDEARHRIADLEQRASDLHAAISEDARLLALADVPTLEQVEERQEEWSREREARRRRDDLTTEASRLEQELESWRESERSRKTDCDNAKAAAEESLRQWEIWLATKKLPSGVTPDAARDLLLQVRSLQERIAERDSTAERLDTQRTGWRAWRTKTEEILAAVTDTPATAFDSGALFERLLALQRSCAEEAARARERASLAQEVADWHSKLANTEREVLRSEREALLAVRTASERLAAGWLSAEPVRTREKARLEGIAGEFERTTGEWREWQECHGLDRQMSPDGVLDFFTAVRRGRDEIQQRDRLRVELHTLREAVAHWEHQVAELLGAAALAVPEAGPDSWIDAARGAAHRCVSDAEARRDAKRLDAAIERAKPEVETLRQKRDRSAEILSALFAEAGVSKEQEYRERLAHYRGCEELKRRRSELETGIVAVLGRGDEAAEMRRELSTGRVTEWTTERSQWANATDTLREQHESAIRRHQDLSNARRELEEATDVADLELQLQAVREELEVAVRRRRATSLAAALVGETLREFERTRQPAVLANASEAFERVTDGRYPRVVQTEDAEGVVVLDHRGARHTVGELSRGTQEQLYLSMRLGLAREFGQRAVPLPLVMDDVLVNFDEERSRRMAIELMAFAETHQVLLFTCHASIRAMLLDLDANVRVIDLPVHEVVGGEATVSQPQAAAQAERAQPSGLPIHEESVLAALAAAESLSLPELAERLGSTAEQVRRILSDLREKELVVMSGQKRGARYSLGNAAQA